VEETILNTDRYEIQRTTWEKVPNKKGVAENILTDSYDEGEKEN